MATLNTKNFTTLVQDQAAAIQARAKMLLDFTVGSILRAVVEATAAVALWLQAEILHVLALTRAATSTGTDLDSFVQDYGLTRLGASVSVGSVTFSRYTNTAQAVIPIGAKVASADGTQGFTVVLDATNSAYNAGLGGYVLAAGVTSIAVPVNADIPSSASNVVAGAVTVIKTPIPGVDTVSNVAAFTSGSDAETDTALRQRFRDYLASLSKATKSAIGNAVTSLKLGMAYTLVENQQYSGAGDNGFFYLVVDDGSGTPPQSLLDTVYQSVDAVRAVGIRFAVFAPSVLTANIAMTLTIKQGYDGPTVRSAVAAAITTFINTLPLGQSLYYTRLPQVAFDASPGVQNVSGVTLNGGTADLAATAKNVVKAGTVTVS